jgi:drug/metabolite transporter (DMT)-like permease
MLAGMRTSPTLLAAFAVAFSGAMWGVWWLPLRAVEEAGAEGLWSNVVIYGAAALVLGPALAKASIRRSVMSLPFLAIALTAGAAWTLWNLSLIHGDVVRSTLLFYLSPIWATLLAALLLRQSFGRLRILSIALGLVGAAAVLGFDEGWPIPETGAEWAATAAGVIFALMTVAVRRFGEVGTLAKSIGAFASTAIISLAAIVIMGGEPPKSGALLASMPYALASLVWLIPLTLFNLWGATRLDPGRVNVLLLMELVLAAISASLLTDEPFGWRETAGCLLIGGAAVIEGVDEILAFRPATPPAPARGSDASRAR